MSVPRLRVLVGILGALLCAGALAQAPAKAPRIGVLQNGSPASTAHPTEAFVRGLAELERVIGQLGRAFLAVEAKAPEELERAFADMTKRRADAVLVITPKAAKAIGVAIPRELLLRAEQVLE